MSKRRYGKFFIQSGMRLLWQCSDDPVVSIEHSRLLANSLRENGVDFRYEVYPYSCHGLDGAASDYEKSWIERATAFWKG